MQKEKSSGLRVVSLGPSVTSILVALGAKDRLVGVTKWCKDVVAPSAVRGLPELGDCWNFDAEQVLRLNPTLVIGSVPYKAELIASLLRAPVPFLATNPRTLEDIYREIQLLGSIVGRTRAAARLVRRMKQKFARLARQADKRHRRPRVYAEAWPNPRISSPPWVAELISLLGGEMVVPAGEKVTDEQIVRAQPEVILLAWAAAGDRPRAQREAERMASRPGWRELPAIRNRRVYVVRDEWLNTPGPPLLHGARALQKILGSAAADSQ
ncbi:MAG: helical backbone metal receptor [Acidobacteriia bacterium]|jgi:iron complex transport system substrate-binding protein|nr:helical backbone metal receptor [Terriglobia bacterium]